MIYHCHECGWVGASNTSAYNHELRRHDGARTCWPQASGENRGAARAAWEQRCREDENWPWGLACWELFDRWSDSAWYRATGRAHRAAYALKAAACVLLRRRGACGDRTVLVAVTDQRSVTTMEGNDHVWTELTVGHGWRPRTWRYAIAQESAL